MLINRTTLSFKRKSLALSVSFNIQIQTTLDNLTFDNPEPLSTVSLFIRTVVHFTVIIYCINRQFDVNYPQNEQCQIKEGELYIPWIHISMSYITPTHIHSRLTHINKSIQLFIIFAWPPYTTVVLYPAVLLVQCKLGEGLPLHRSDYIILV